MEAKRTARRICRVGVNEVCFWIHSSLADVFDGDVATLSNSNKHIINQSQCGDGVFSERKTQVHGAIQ